MQARTLLPCLFALSVIITGCPDSTGYPFSDKSSADNFDKALIGFWLNNNENAEAKEVFIKKGHEENTYTIKVTKEGSSFMADTDTFTGWVTTFKKEKFLVLEEVYHGTSEGIFYLYQFKMDGNKLSTHYLNLESEVVEKIRSTGEYQDIVTKLMNGKGFLKGEINWERLGRK